MVRCWAVALRARTVRPDFRCLVVVFMVSTTMLGGAGGPRNSGCPIQSRSVRLSGVAMRPTISACPPSLLSKKISYRTLRTVKTAVDGCGFHTAASFCLTVSTGHSASRTTFSATDPKTQRSRPVDPCVEMTIRSAPSVLAIRTISSAAAP